MSVSYYSNVVVGVRLSDLNPTEFKKTVISTKFDVDTGEPYERKDYVDYVNLGDGEFEGTLKKVLSEEEMDENHLEVFSFSYIEDMLRNNKDNTKAYKNILVGTEISSVSDWGDNSVSEINLDDLLQKKVEVAANLKAAFGYKGEIKVFNFLHCSY